MKNIQKILWLGLLVSAVGCNSGVFIDDYLPEVPVVQSVSYTHLTLPTIA